MSAEDNSSAESADIGEALVAALGFEPAAGRKQGRKAASRPADDLVDPSDASPSVDDAFAVVVPSSESKPSAGSPKGSESPASSGGTSGGKGADGALETSDLTIEIAKGDSAAETSSSGGNKTGSSSPSTGTQAGNQNRSNRSRKAKKRRKTAGAAGGSSNSRQSGGGGSATGSASGGAASPNVASDDIKSAAKPIVSTSPEATPSSARSSASPEALPGSSKVEKLLDDGSIGIRDSNKSSSTSSSNPKSDAAKPGAAKSEAGKSGAAKSEAGKSGAAKAEKSNSFTKGLTDQKSSAEPKDSKTANGQSGAPQTSSPANGAARPAAESAAAKVGSAASDVAAAEANKERSIAESAAVTGDLADIIGLAPEPPPPSASDAIKLDTDTADGSLPSTAAAKVADPSVPTGPPAMPASTDAPTAAMPTAKQLEKVKNDSSPAKPIAEKQRVEVKGDEPLQPAAKVGTAPAKPGSGFDLANLPSVFRRKRRVQARKVRRVIRHIDPWSVLTFSVLFHLSVFAALLLASVLVWNAAEAAGTIENLEAFILDLGDYETFEIKGDVVFRAAVAIAGILTLASSVLLVLLTVVFNLISDLVGGIRLTVIEEETVRVRRKKSA